MSSPTERQLAFALALGLKADLSASRAEMSSRIDTALENAKEQPPAEIQRQIAKAWGVRLGKNDTRDDAASKLFEAWEDDPEVDIPDDLIVQPRGSGCGLAIAALLAIVGGFAVASL